MDLNDTARDILARKGIDPAAVPSPAPFDPARFLVEQAHAALALAVPDRFIDAVADHPQVTDWVQRFLTDRRATPSLLLLGTVGTGKTHQAYGALRAVVLATADAGRRLTWRATTHPQFNAAMRPTDDDSHLRVFDDCCTADLLVFDDLGAGKMSDWTGDTLYRLIDTRWANQRPTILTTNLPPVVPADRRHMLTGPTLPEAVGDRIVSRLADGLVVRLVGADRRRAGGTA